MRAKTLVKSTPGENLNNLFHIYILSLAIYHDTQVLSPNFADKIGDFKIAGDVYLQKSVLTFFLITHVFNYEYKTK